MEKLTDAEIQRMLECTRKGGLKNTSDALEELLEARRLMREYQWFHVPRDGSEFYPFRLHQSFWDGGEK